MTDFMIFYSWQSDLPNPTNRGFIEKALQNATKALQRDESITVEPVIRSDTAGLPGTPNIAEAIFERIENAQVFVADVSIINESAASRPTPNPNVLIELGYAVKALGEERLIMVMNTAYGPLESLPFDLRTRRIIPYRMPLENQDRATVRQQLERTIEGALRTILEQVVASLPNPPSLLDESLLSIQNASPNQTTLLRRYMDELVARLLVLAPDFTTEGANVERLLEALEQSKSIVAEFAHLTEQAAAMNSSAAINTIYRGFSGILNRYSVPNGYSGSCQTTGFDFYKFIGHELFVTLFLHLIQEERWESIADILEQGIYVENTYQHRPGTVSFEEISDSVELLDYHGRQPSVRRVSVHADMLNTRHGEGKLGDIAPMRQFMEADYFLFLRSEFQQSEPSQYLVGWRPWSMLYMGGQTPRYLVEATYKAQAQKLLRPLGVKDIDTLRLYLTERAPKIHKMFLHRTSGRPLVEINPEVIGTK